MIIDHNKRRGEKKIFDYFQKRRYSERSTAEGVNSNIKDNYGGRNIRVKGHKKVLTHLMFTSSWSTMKAKRDRLAKEYASENKKNSFIAALCKGLLNRSEIYPVRRLFIFSRGRS